LRLLIEDPDAEPQGRCRGRRARRTRDFDTGSRTRRREGGAPGAVPGAGCRGDDRAAL